MSDPHWYNPYAGLHWAIQTLFWLVFVAVMLGFVDIVVLYVAARRQRRRRLPDVPESSYHWVFVVPALNEEVTIADSVGRLAQLDVTHKTFLVVDDGSDDSTPQILQSLDVPGLSVLRRDLPDARKGKAQALNAAWREVHRRLDGDTLGADRGIRWSADQVIMVIVDADGRLDRHAPGFIARHFADPRIGGVQTLVRIYNRQRILTWAQDVEFSVFGRVYQLGRAWFGIANMGGNGQANRLSALDSIVGDGAGPWRDKLTEDQDLGVRLLQAGWAAAQDTDAFVEQQGVSSLRRLYRQRTRWSQGAWETIPLARGVRRIEASVFAKIDYFYYLITPAVQLLTGIGLATSIVVAFTHRLAFWAAAVPVLIFFLALTIGPGFFGIISGGKGIGRLFTAIVLVVPYTIYSWLIYPVVIRALMRLLIGANSWAKTDREPIDDGTHTEVTPIRA